MADHSRRTILRGVTFAGAASVGGASGVGTYAYLTDSEPFPSNSMASGAFDLEIATRTESGSTTTYTPNQEGSFPSTFVAESTVSVEFPNVDPSEDRPSGSTTVAFRVCSNPGRVWFRMNGEEPDPLANALDVTATYAPRCGESSHVFYEGSLSGLIDASTDGIRLGATDCQNLGKVEIHEDPYEFVAEGTGDSLAVEDVPGTLNLDGLDGPVAVEITGLHWKPDGEEISGVDLAAEDFELCRVDVKGGGSSDDRVEIYWPSCSSTATELMTEANSAGIPSGLSHFVVHACSGEHGCVTCDPACLTLDWTIPDPSSVAGESLSFDLELFANQCRHTEPRNPWQ